MRIFALTGNKTNKKTAQKHFLRGHGQRPSIGPDYQNIELLPVSVSTPSQRWWLAFFPNLFDELGWLSVRWYQTPTNIILSVGYMGETSIFALDIVPRWNIHRQPTYLSRWHVYALCPVHNVKRRWWKHGSLYRFVVCHLSGPFSMHRCISPRIYPCVMSPPFALLLIFRIHFSSKIEPFPFIFRSMAAPSIYFSCEAQYVNDPYSMPHCMSTRVPFVTWRLAQGTQGTFSLPVECWHTFLRAHHDL